MPSKTYDLMATGTGIIGISNGDDDLSTLIQKKKIGFCITNNSAEGLADIIVKLYQNPKEGEVLGERARKVIEEEYSEKVLINKYRKYVNDNSLDVVFLGYLKKEELLEIIKHTILVFPSYIILLYHTEQ